MTLVRYGGERARHARFRVAGVTAAPNEDWQQVIAPTIDATLRCWRAGIWAVMLMPSAAVLA